MLTRIAVLGDFNPIYSTHHALNDSIRHIQKHLGQETQFDWIATDVFHYRNAFDSGMYRGLWIAPGSPYKSMENVLKTIAYTRQNSIPTFGNCGGFQHMVIEFARDVCGIENADHEETNPDAKDILISKLSCSLVEQEENLSVIDKTSLLFSILKAEKLLGKYFCSYGINSRYLDTLQSYGLRFTAQSEDGQMRAFEIKSHPFFVGTLFQPALISTVEKPNPIIVEFVKSCLSSQ